MKSPYFINLLIYVYNNLILFYRKLQINVEKIKNLLVSEKTLNDKNCYLINY